jgi:uncharacterized protein (TIGR03066 family)
MRMMMGILFLFGLCAISTADEDKLDEKFLIGTWSIKFVSGNGKEDKEVKTIEFKEDGTYVWIIAGVKSEGTYKLKGTTISLVQKGVKSTSWSKLSIMDGKIIRPGVKTSHEELTRIEKKDKN